MDGINKMAIITTKIEWPNGITIDYTNDKLYWSDAHLGYIEYVKRPILRFTSFFFSWDTSVACAVVSLLIPWAVSANQKMQKCQTGEKISA